MAQQRTVSVKVSLLASDYFLGLRKMQEETKKATLSAEQSFARMRTGYTQVGTAMVVAGGGITVALGAAVKASADFGAKMAQLQTLLHATPAQMKQLSDAAFTAGTSFGYSATQVADAQIELAKAGVTAKQQIGGALTGSLALAAAGQLNVADATSVAVTAMTDFKLRASDLPHVADLLAAGADKSTASVQSIGQALQQSGLVAAQFGLSVDDTVGVLTAFAQAGLQGSDAGTSLKQMLLQVATPTKQAKDLMSQLGISAYDASGQFVGITKFAGILQDRLKGLSPAARQSAEGIIFGSDAIRSANVLYDLGSKKLAGYIKANEEVGFASAQAAGKLNSLQGDVQKLSATFQNDLIKAGSGVNGELRILAQRADGVLTTFGNIPAPVLEVGTSLAGVAGGVTLLGGAFLLAIPKIAEFKLAMKEVGLTGKSTAGVIGKGTAIAAGVADLALGFADLSTQANTTAQDVERAGVVMSKGFKGVDALFPKTGVALNSGTGLKNAVQEFQNGDAAGAKYLDNITQGLTHFSDVYKTTAGTLDALGQQIAGLSKTNYSAGAASFNELAAKYHLTSDEQKTLLDQMPAYKSALVELAGKAHVAATDTNLLAGAQNKGAVGAKLAAAAAREVASSTETQTAALHGDVDALNLVYTAQKKLSQTAQGLESSQDAALDAIEQVSASLKQNGATLDQNTAKGRANREQTNSAIQTIQAHADAINADGKHAAQASVYTDRMAVSLENTMVAAGLGRKAAERYVNTLLGIPKNKSTKLALDEAIAAAKLAAFKVKWDSIQSKTVNLFAKTNTINDSGLAGTVAARRATGGMMPSIGPKGKDSFLIAAGAGEYMFSARSVDRAGGPAAMSRLDAAIQNGMLQGFKDGGAIGDSTSAAAKALRDINRYKTQLAAAKKTESSTQKAYDAIDSSKKNHAAKVAAKAKHDAASKRVDDLQKKLDDARQARSDANSAAADLRNDREDFVSTQRRATADNPIDPLSYIDQLRSMSRDDNFTVARRKTFDNAANQYEKSLVTQTTALDMYTTTLNNLKDAADSMKSSITSAIAGGYALSNVGSTSAASGTFTRNGIQFTSYGSGTTASSIDAYYQQGASDTASFAADLKILASRGVAPALLAELAGYGVAQGAPIAKALLSGTASQLASISASYNAIQGNAATAAGTVTDANYAAQIAAAQANADQITAQIASDGEKLRKLIAQAFGLTGYAIGTMSATPGWHLVGEKGPELLRFAGGEQVTTAARTRSMVAAASSRSGGTPIVRMPDTITVQDASGFVATMRVVAKQEIATDAHNDAVMIYGGSVL